MVHATTLFWGLTILSGWISTTITASALTLPDSGTANTTGAALSITNTDTSFGSGLSATASGSSSSAIVAHSANLGISGYGTNGGVFGNSTAGIGVYGGASTGIGTEGYSTNGPGVQGMSQSGHGVYGNSTAAGGCGVYAENDAHGYGVGGRISPPGAGFAVYGDNNSSSGWAGYFNGNIKFTGVAHSSTSSSITLDSDIRLKKNIEPLAGGLDRLLQLRPVTFEWKSPQEHGNRTDEQRVHRSDVEKVFPEWVSVDPRMGTRPST